MDDRCIDILRGLAEAVIEEAEKNEAFRSRIEDVLSGMVDLAASKPAKKTSKVGRSANRRDPAVLDPISLIAESEEELVKQLNGLTDKELKDIIADYAMDPSKLAMKWKDRDRLINHIVDASRRRASKGDAFRDQAE